MFENRVDDGACVFKIGGVTDPSDTQRKAVF
jgi:hypothetical protein